MKAHKENEHGEESNKMLVDKDFVSNLLEANAKLNDEIRDVKDNFERLSDIYQKEQAHSVDKKFDIEIELSKTREEYKRVKAENEELKIKNDTLFKLGNIATQQNDRLKKNQLEPTKVDKPKVDKLKEDVIKVIDEEEVTVEDLNDLVNNKKSGFNRPNPCEQPKQNKSPLPSATSPTRSPLSPSLSPAPAPPSPASSSEKVSPAEEIEDERRKSTIRYCHYFSNGKCNFEEWTGKKCIFEHTKAPSCKYDGSCTREKCMFSHPNKSGQKSKPFLGVRQAQNRRPIQIQDFMEQLLEAMQSQQSNQQYQGQNRGRKGQNKF